VDQYWPVTDLCDWHYCGDIVAGLTKVSPLTLLWLTCEYSDSGQPGPWRWPQWAWPWTAWDQDCYCDCVVLYCCVYWTVVTVIVKPYWTDLTLLCNYSGGTDIVSIVIEARTAWLVGCGPAQLATLRLSPGQPCGQTALNLGQPRPDSQTDSGHAGGPHCWWPGLTIGQLWILYWLRPVIPLLCVLCIVLLLLLLLCIVTSGPDRTMTPVMIRYCVLLGHCYYYLQYWLCYWPVVIVIWYLLLLVLHYYY